MLRVEDEEEEGRGTQGARAGTARITKAHFSAPCSGILPWPQSGFCTQARDLLLNATGLAEAAAAASCPFQALWRLNNKPLFTERTRVHSDSSQSVKCLLRWTSSRACYTRRVGGWRGLPWRTRSVPRSGRTRSVLRASFFPFQWIQTKIDSCQGFPIT